MYRMDGPLPDRNEGQDGQEGRTTLTPRQEGRTLWTGWMVSSHPLTGGKDRMDRMDGPLPPPDRKEGQDGQDGRTPPTP